MAFRVLKTENHDLNRVQDEITKAFAELKLQIGQNGVLLENQSIATADTIINHGLGRKYRGWIVVKKIANVDIWESTSTNHRPELGIILKASSAAVVTLWVF
jgi:hypothetical protein